jgi:hypothetical protein
MSERAFWTHLHALAELAAAAPNQRHFLDSVIADLPSLDPRTQQSLRMQLQSLVCALPAITHLARPSAGRAETSVKPRTSSPPYMS